MILTIEVVESQFTDSAVALVFGEHADGIVGASGSDPRAATNAALAAYWKQQDALVQSQSIFATHGEGRRPAATGYGAILALLQAAIKSNPRDVVKIGYSDAQGNFTVREITPSQIDGELVTAYDIARDDARTFRLDRISNAEIVR